MRTSRHPTRARRAAAALALLGAALAPLPAAAAEFDEYKAIALSAGQWRYRALADGSEARFGDSFALRCHRPTRQVFVSRLGVVADGAMTILTSSAEKSLAAGSALAASDPFLDSLAFSRGRFIVSVGRLLPLLAVPSWPEAARSIEDCRI